MDEVGQGGGSLSPAVYDTAQLLRFAPPADPRPVVEWLLAQQGEDGGWGSTLAPLARDTSTLAAILALHQSQPREQACRLAVWRGLRFLARHAACWGRPLPDDLPLAAEIVVPALLDEAQRQGLPVPEQHYAALRVLGSARRHLVGKLSAGVASPEAHAWEAWGESPSAELLDESGGVGHSPAATARWLQLARAGGATSDVLALAEGYLAQASAATPAGIPGVVPTVWPIDRFEQSALLYALSCTDLLHHPALRFRAHAQLRELRQALRGGGVGLSSHFSADGDLTAMALAVLAAGGHDVDVEPLRRFQRGERFVTYAHELQPALTTTARAVAALAQLGQQVAGPVRFLAASQGADGRWPADSRHGSWVYTSSQVLIALAQLGPGEELCRGAMALLLAQRADGGWGAEGLSTPAETAYAVHALCAIRLLPLFDEPLQQALQRAQRWMRYCVDMPQERHALAWVGKELYCPYRVDQALVLTALLALELDEPELEDRAAVRTRRCI